MSEEMHQIERHDNLLSNYSIGEDERFILDSSDNKWVYYLFRLDNSQDPSIIKDCKAHN